MARHDKPKRKKAYRPRPETKFGGLHIISERMVQANPLTEEEQIHVSADYYAALTAMIEGRGESGHFDSLVYAVNIARILANNGIGEEYDELVYPALCAMKRCKERWARTGKFGLDGEGVQALRAMASLHEAQLEVTTAAELKAAIAEMHRRVAAGWEFQEKEAA
jgi:hypothetical protein